MGKRLREAKDCSNFILILIFFFSGAGAIVSFLIVGKPQWFGNYKPIDLAIGGSTACVVVGLIFFLRSLKKCRRA